MPTVAPQSLKHAHFLEKAEFKHQISSVGVASTSAPILWVTGAGPKGQSVNQPQSGDLRAPPLPPPLTLPPPPPQLDPSLQS